jgi:hypothetical protein
VYLDDLDSRRVALGIALPIFANSLVLIEAGTVLAPHVYYYIPLAPLE